MRLHTLLERLPYSLLLASLALAATAVPVDAQEPELRVLTPDDFDETVATGVWFIEHFSPYCVHCRNFAPTWEKLVGEVEAQADPGIHLAQVNCAVHGDLCSKNNVDAYPKLNLYRDGAYVETFTKPREWDLLWEYVTSNAAHAALPEPSPEPTTTTAPPAGITGVPVQEKEREEGTPVRAPAAVPVKVYNALGTVRALDEKSFPDAIKEGHIFIKFFAPWCGHCKKLAPTWTALAASMQGKVNVAEVDCEDHAAICRGQGVNGYPMLFYYSGGGKSKTEYTGGRKLEQLMAFVEKVSGPAVKELGYEELQATVAEHPVIYLLLHPASDTQSLTDVTEASHVLFGSPPIFTSSAPSFYDHFNLQRSQSMILAFKDHDYSAPAATFPIPQSLARESAQASLNEWLLHNRLPTALELDSDTFQDVMYAPHHPLVVLAAALPAELASAAEKMSDLAARWKRSKARGDVVFAWMDADRWGKWLKSMYGVSADAGTQIVVADHSRLVYYDVDQRGEKIRLTATSVFSAVHGAQAGTISSKHSENIVERFARYMNGVLTVLEHVVSDHPWRVTFFIVASLACVIVYLRRVIYAESALADEMSRKARLD